MFELEKMILHMNGRGSSLKLVDLMPEKPLGVV
jgi:hypothetical protein